MSRRKETERELRAEIRRLKAALSGIHDRLHADDVNGAHEACECAIDGGAVTQPNLTPAAAAAVMDLAAEFNALIDRRKVRACCVTLVPSATVKGATSIQLCGEVFACKLVERALRGEASVYMGDHRQASAAERVGFPHLADALRQIPERQ